MEMQNAQTAYLEVIEGLLEESEIEKAIDALLKLDQLTQAGLRYDIVQQSGNYRQAAREYSGNRIDFKEFSISSAKARNALLELMQELPQRVKQDAVIRTIGAFQFQVPDTEHLEKIIGQQSNILKINWLEKALQASKAVCRVVCANGEMGTGLLTREGYIFTNHHVIPSAEVAASVRVEFNYELDTAGNVRARTVYQLEATDFATSPSDQLDFTRVQVRDRDDAPLRQWGFVEFDPEALPVVGEAVTIIQHPKGEDKQIALHANEVLSVWNQYVFYTTDTEPGSSGSPVFNKDWRVVAIHHAGQTEQGGLQINARGDHRKANRGILFRDIFGFLDTPANQQAPEAIKLENDTKTTDRSTPVQAVPARAPELPVAPPPVAAPSAIPKFVMVYDVADTSHCQLLNKYLNILKITKKIRVYNVQDALAADLLTSAEAEIADADYLLVLITVNLTNSPDWLGLVLQALEQGRRVIPIRIEKVNYDGTGLERLRALPSMNRAVADFANLDAAYTDIVTELRKLLPK